MDDLISRDMALEKMADYVSSGYANSAEDFEEYSKIICQLPPVSLERPKGKWKPYDFPWFECSECGAVRNNQSFLEYFCPNCGADMRGDKDE